MDHTLNLNGSRCQVCNEKPSVLGVNSRPPRLIICEDCDRKNNPYYYQELPPPLPTQTTMELLFL